jgi:histone arginine demethylase JMJD6
MAMKSVDRLPPNVDFELIFENHIVTGCPCILTDGARNWPARKRWTQEFLIQNFGDVIVDFVDVNSGSRSHRSLREYFNLPKDEASRYYLCDWDFRKHYPDLLKDIEQIPQLNIDWIQEIPSIQQPDLMWIYIGQARTYGKTHIDNYGTSAWLALLQGNKRVRFLQPIKGLTPSKINLFGEDFLDSICEAEMFPGDILYVPSGIWHAAYNDTYCLSITANFIDGSNFMEYYSYSTRSWHGRRILISCLNTIQDLPPSSSRRNQSKHLKLAIQRYEEWLNNQLIELKHFRNVLNNLDK